MVRPSPASLLHSRPPRPRPPLCSHAKKQHGGTSEVSVLRQLSRKRRACELVESTRAHAIQLRESPDVNRKSRRQSSENDASDESPGGRARLAGPSGEGLRIGSLDLAFEFVETLLDHDLGQVRDHFPGHLAKGVFRE